MSVLWSRPVSATHLTVGPPGAVAWAPSSASPALYQWTTALSADGGVVYDLFAPVPPTGPYPYYAALDTSGRFYAGGSPSVSAAADGDASLNLLQYSPPLLCFLICMLIVLRQHPARGPKSLAPDLPLAAASAA